MALILTFFNIILGPISFQFNDLSKDPLKLVLNPYSWTKVWNFLSLGFSFPIDGENLKIGPIIYFQVANIIFLDAPAATGYSYSTTLEGLISSDTLHATRAYQFLQKVSQDLHAKIWR